MSISRLNKCFIITSVIIFENTTKKYKSAVVLDRVSCEIGGGEFVSIVGSSGAGKSTFIHLLIGAVRPTSGRVVVDGYSIGDLTEDNLALYHRRIGVIFQDFKLLEKKTVYENVAFALEVCGDSAAAICQRVPEVLEIVGLSHKAQAFPTELSGGEKQRVAIARALVHEPALIIADEPTGNLDPETGRGIIDLLLDINQAGATVLLATHDRETVDRIRRRVIRLEGGKLISDLANAGYHVKE